MSSTTDDRRLGALVAAAAALMVGAATLTPGHGIEGPHAMRTCIACVPAWRADFLANVMLFIPFGFGVRRAGIPLALAVLLTLFATCSVEVLQMGTIPGRDPSLADIIANTVGGGIGLLLGGRRPWHTLALREARRTWRLALGCWCAVVALGTVALLPAPVTQRLLVQTGRSAGDIDPNAGSVVSAAVGSVQVGNHMVPEHATTAMRSALPVRVELRPAGRVAKATNIAGFEDDGGSLLWITQAGRDLVLNRETLGSRFFFHDPSLRIPDAFPDSADGVLSRVTVVATRSERRIELVRGSSRITASLNIGPMLAWTLIGPGSEIQDRFTLIGTILWGALLTIPVGYLSRLAWREADEIVFGTGMTMGTLVLALAVLDVALGIRVTSLDLIGVGAGLALGVMAAQARLSRQRVPSHVHPRPALSLGLSTAAR